ncbi:AAA family ATPase [Roseicyclus mahoneyensis]|uniref:AAA domain-containing protein n=1 Tax=Roseicyclus mahoneyensis TaxID=164332 RepID=A0A316G7U4_9RHOB|nr:AAA family ATPase [Roseicyclus mahoneyensis]PWK56723.1 AAA domain-containing protein [Roseicyclus mahoneyensis]
MSDSAIIGKGDDTVPKRLLVWSENRPLWQRDALRRIVLNGYPDEEAFEELLALCKLEHGDATVTLVAEPLSKDHLPVDPGAGESISLSSITNVSGVNQLATGQTLNFEESGLTIVYGQNGTGKSGYTRILKKACRSRHAGEIMPDVYSSSPTRTAKADLKITRTGGASETVAWEDDGGSAETLSAITVFDRDAASVHVQKKNEVWFRPFGLDIPDDLAGVCQEIKTRLTSEKETLEQKRNSVFANPTWSSRSALGKALSSLQHDTDIAAITPRTPFSDADEARLTKLQADLAQDPAVAAKAQRDYATQLDQLASYLKRIEQALNDEAIQALYTTKKRADDMRTAANTAAHDAFSGLALEGVGETVWRTLWESARSYSQVAKEAGAVFPPSPGDICVLCHQEIDEPTAARMLGFEDFIKKDTETKAAEAERTFKEAEKKFRGVAVHINKVSAAYRHLKAGNFTLARKVLRFIALARRVQVQTLVQLSGEDVPNPLALPESGAEAVNTEAAQTRAYAVSLDDASGGEAREAVLNEQADLQDRKQSRELLDIVKTEIARLAELKRTENCLRDTATTAITRLGNEIADTLITPRMRDRFQQEIVALAGNRVRVEVVRSGGKFGSPQYEVKLYANPKAKVHDVLSEGEQTCVALASYLTELANASHTSALVFDDPVSSLDHRWRSKVAKRLAKEAGERQVIVFTHDMIFVNDLAQLASKRNTPIALAHLTRGQDVVGIVNKDLPWTASSIRDRIDKLEKEARAAKRLFEAHDDEGYKTEVSSLYSRLRATWERALEDIVFANVVMRHRDYIDTKNLKRVTALEDADVHGFQIGFKKCCDFVDAHDPSRGHDPEPPEPVEIMADIQALKVWSEALRIKMNGVS